MAFIALHQISNGPYAMSAIKSPSMLQLEERLLQTIPRHPTMRQTNARAILHVVSAPKSTVFDMERDIHLDLLPLASEATSTRLAVGFLAYKPCTATYHPGLNVPWALRTSACIRTMIVKMRGSCQASRRYKRTTSLQPITYVISSADCSFTKSIRVVHLESG